MSYVDRVLNQLRERHGEQKEFMQAVEEVLESLRVVIDENEEEYSRLALLERL